MVRKIQITKSQFTAGGKASKIIFTQNPLTVEMFIKHFLTEQSVIVKQWRINGLLE